MQAVHGVRLGREPLLRVQFFVEETGLVAPDASGAVRSMHRFSGGTFEGEGFSGVVVPGGGDKAVRISDDWVEIDAHAMLRTREGVNILLSYRGVWRAEPGAIAKVLGPDGHDRFSEGEHYLRTTARFDAGVSGHARLNGVLAVGRGRKSAGGIEHIFFEVL